MASENRDAFLRARDALMAVRELESVEAGALTQALYVLIGSNDPDDLPAMCAVTAQAESLLGEL